MSNTPEELKYRGMSLPNWIREYHKQSVIRQMEPEEVELLSLVTAALKWSNQLSRPTNGLEEAYGYASRLFKSLAPQCEVLPDIMGVLTQIDNWCSAPHKQNNGLEDALTRIMLFPTQELEQGDDIIRANTMSQIARCALEAHRGRGNDAN